MKTKQNINSLLMKNYFLIMLLFTAMVNAQIVNIPDANFKAKLLSATTSNNVAWITSSFSNVKIDTNSDGEIQQSEAQAIIGLDISSAAISDLTGINSFSNLQYLTCSNNSLTALNCSGITNLVSLDCSHNQLTSLNVNVVTDLLPGLQWLNCSYNQFTTLDLSNNGGIRLLSCAYNLLTQLDVSNLSALATLNCSHNALTDLNLHCSDLFSGLSAEGNQLTSLDFTGTNHLDNFIVYDNLFTDLSFTDGMTFNEFDIHNNQIQDLDLSNVYLLDYPELGSPGHASFVGNPLRTLNMKNGSIDNIFVFDALNEVTTWEFICADEDEVATVVLNQPTVVVNSYCSFMPGGNYNTIAGNIKYDADNNGCDASDAVFPNFRVNIDDDTTTGASFTNNAGNYAFYTLAGSFNVTPAIENPAWFNVAPTTVTIPFANSNNNSAVQDFCIAPNGTHPDLESVVSAVIPARPGFDAHYKIVYRNKGNTTMPGEPFGIQLNYESDKIDYVSSAQPVSFVGSNFINFGYPALRPFESRSIDVRFHVHSPTDVAPVNIGNALTFTSAISPTNNDETTADNSFILHQTVVGSYDPNDITCLEGPLVPPSEIGNYLHYAINFENTGTFEAENIVVKTLVDAAQFDVHSLQLMNTSHLVDARTAGNKVEFIFKNIQLPIGGHGHILLKIKTKNTLLTGDAVAKRADIFFDYNAPVDTGFANTVFQNLSNTDFEIDASVLVSPNPASNEVTVKSDNTIKSIQLYDVQGRIISTSLINETESKLEISDFAKGIYFIKIATTKGIKIQKLLKK